MTSRLDLHGLFCMLGDLCGGKYLWKIKQSRHHVSRNYRDHKQGTQPISVPVQSVLTCLENPKSLNTCIHMYIFVYIHTYIHVCNLLRICKAFSSPRKSHSHTLIPRAPTSVAGAKLRFSNSHELESDLRTQMDKGESREAS